MSWKAEPTSVVWLDEKKQSPVVVNTLPEDIKFDIETYDRMRQSFLDLRYQLEVLQLAISGKHGQIVMKIRALVDAQNVANATQTTGEQREAISKE